ncbi:unnamed protein product, partial [Rotaria magnacalcarata]
MPANIKAARFKLSLNASKLDVEFFFVVVDDSLVVSKVNLE